MMIDVLTLLFSLVAACGNLLDCLPAAAPGLAPMSDMRILLAGAAFGAALALPLFGIVLGLLLGG